MKKISEFLSENFQFLEVKFSIYLNRHVFVMSLNVDYSGILFAQLYCIVSFFVFLPTIM